MLEEYTSYEAAIVYRAATLLFGERIAKNQVSLMRSLLKQRIGSRIHISVYPRKDPKDGYVSEAAEVEFRFSETVLPGYTKCHFHATLYFIDKNFDGMNIVAVDCIMPSTLPDASAHDIAILAIGKVD